MTILQRNIPNSALAVPKEKRPFLTYPATGLVSCVLEETDDSVNFVFDANGMEPAEHISAYPKWDQLRFLVNCAGLEKTSSLYDFSMALTNLQMDINLVPQALVRDQREPGENDFLNCYKALIGSVLRPKVAYDNYLSGGDGLYKKNRLLARLAALDTVADIQQALVKEHQKLLEKTKRTKKLVARKNVIISRLSIPLLTVALLVAAFFIGRFILVEVPFRDRVIAASLAYINNDPLTVQRELRSYPVDRLSDETLHFLSRSYVATEALTPTQINTILVGLSRLTAPIVFEYWIHLGRLYFAEAIDIAQRLGDDELLLFAYLKQQEYVRGDMSLTGEERTTTLNYLQGQIERLQRERDEAAAELP